MQFSFRLPVAVHIMLCLAEFQGKQKTTSTFLAGSVNVNPVVIRKTLGQLKAANLVTVTAGTGGAQLKKAPEDITLLDAFRAVEDDEDLFHFHEHPNPKCPVGRNIHAMLEKRFALIKQHMMRDLADVTLQDLLDSMN